MSLIYVNTQIQVGIDQPSHPALGWIRTHAIERPVFTNVAPRIVNVITDTTSLLEDSEKFSFTAYEIQDKETLEYFVYDVVQEKWYPSVLPGKLSFKYEGGRLTLIMLDDFTYSYDSVLKKGYLELSDSYDYTYIDGKVVISEV